MGFGIAAVGFTLSTAGKVLIAYTAIVVHHRFRKEMKVDEAVFRVMKRESAIGILGLVLIIVGYALEIPSRLG